MNAAIGFLLGILLASPVAYLLGRLSGLKRMGAPPPLRWRRMTGIDTSGDAGETSWHFPARWEGGK